MTDNDAVVAERVMGWVRKPDPTSGDGKGWYWELPDGSRDQISRTPRYSTDISDAWDVVERIAAHQDEAVRQRFIDQLLRTGFALDRKTAAKNICAAALWATAEPTE